MAASYSEHPSIMDAPLYLWINILAASLRGGFRIAIGILEPFHLFRRLRRASKSVQDITSSPSDSVLPPAKLSL